MQSKKTMTIGLAWTECLHKQLNHEKSSQRYQRSLKFYNCVDTQFALASVQGQASPYPTWPVVHPDPSSKALPQQSDQHPFVGQASQWNRSVGNHHELVNQVCSAMQVYIKACQSAVCPRSNSRNHLTWSERPTQGSTLLYHPTHDTP